MPDLTINSRNFATALSDSQTQALRVHWGTWFPLAQALQQKTNARTVELLRIARALDWEVDFTQTYLGSDKIQAIQIIGENGKARLAFNRQGRMTQAWLDSQPNVPDSYGWQTTWGAEYTGKQRFELVKQWLWNGDAELAQQRLRDRGVL